MSPGQDVRICSCKHSINRWQLPSLNSKLCHFELESIIAQGKDTLGGYLNCILHRKDATKCPDNHTQKLFHHFLCLIWNFNSRKRSDILNKYSWLRGNGAALSLSTRHQKREWNIGQGIKMGYLINRNEFRCSMMIRVYLYCDPALSWLWWRVMCNAVMTGMTQLPTDYCVWLD